VFIWQANTPRRHPVTSVQRFLQVSLLLLAVTACSVNPVTGKREITFVGTESEIQMGRQNYQPMQQSQGGVYDVDESLTDYVDEVGDRLAAVSDRELPYEFVVLNNSVPNAWALPGGKIAINRGLLVELNSEAELAAVLGHEIVHAAARHSARQIERGMLLQGVVLVTAVATSDSSYGDYATGGANIGAQLLSQSYGRGAELESDLYGMRYMARANYDLQGAVSLQETFVRLSEGQESDWMSGLFASHPPSRERVEANIRTAAEFPAGGETGADRFQAVMAKTITALPAYAAYDEGRAALAEDDVAKAVNQAEMAIALFPEEANFYALRGDARYLDKKYDMAISNFDSAIRRRNNFFYYYLQRGRAHGELEADDLAVQDLEKSLTLLPTGLAHFSLGNIATRRGDHAAAIEHYREAAGGQGEYAESAKISLVRLDLADNPDTYVLTRCDVDTAGQLIVSVKNNTAVTIEGVAMNISFIDRSGTSRTSQRSVRGRMAPEQLISVNSGLLTYSTDSRCTATVVAALIVE
jgi:predicted Zn-dependent protease